MGEIENIYHHRAVVKLGANLITGGGDYLELGIMSSLVGQIARMHRQGAEIVLVSSGAIAAGRHKLGLIQEHEAASVSTVKRCKHYEKVQALRKGASTTKKQVLAAVGQNCLMHAYEQLFSWHNITIAQALLTKNDMSDRAGYLNARNTLLGLLELRVLPIVNENDVVAIDEIREAKFGDNDNLSAMVANLVDADLLVLLSDVGGLYTADPHLDSEVQLIPVVERIDSHIEQLAGDTLSQRGIGGMVTKVEAARLATSSGVMTVIADGRTPEIIPRLIKGEQIGTRFLPITTQLESRKRWMLSGLGYKRKRYEKGEILIDTGAAQALKERGSLLPAGIKAVRGNFQRGDIVNIVDPEGNSIAHGISNYSSADIDIIKGTHSNRITDLLGYEYGDEVVHRNNLVML